MMSHHRTDRGRPPTAPPLNRTPITAPEHFAVSDDELYRFDQNGALVETHLPLPRRRGKVREVYDIGEQRLLVVATDRISAFDFGLTPGIPGKGELLTDISRRWFAHLDTPHHLLDDDPADVLPTGVDPAPLRGRAMVVRSAAVVPFECVVRGYLEGSGWREYQQTGVVGGHHLPEGLQQCDRLPELIFTPATKADEGHDENVTFDRMADEIGVDLAAELRERSLNVYARAANLAADAGIIIADTKFEFGHDADGLLMLIDEVLTPDSSRFWDAGSYAPGRSQPSMDKQFVREYLSDSDWDLRSPPPPLPDDVVRRTAEKYAAARDRLAVVLG